MLLSLLPLRQPGKVGRLPIIVWKPTFNFCEALQLCEQPARQATRNGGVEWTALIEHYETRYITFEQFKECACNDSIGRWTCHVL